MSPCAGERRACLQLAPLLSPELVTGAAILQEGAAGRIALSHRSRTGKPSTLLLLHASICFPCSQSPTAVRKEGSMERRAWFCIAGSLQAKRGSAPDGHSRDAHGCALAALA